MQLDVELRNEFSEKIKTGVKELIDLNQIKDLEDFDAGLFISNVFDRTLKQEFDLKSLDESQTQSLRAFLWSAVYNPLEIEKYELYIKENIDNQ